jgi:hypothetical protein
MDPEHSVSVGLSPRESAELLMRRITNGNAYARGRKTQFMRMASAIRVLSLFLSSSATIILGLQGLGFWAGLGFSLVAVATAVSAVEPFFAWRSRWIMMKEMQHRFYQIADRLEHYLATYNERRLPCMI